MLLIYTANRLGITNTPTLLISIDRATDLG